MAIKAKEVRILSAQEVASLDYTPPTAAKNRPAVPKYFERQDRQVPAFRAKKRIGMK